MKKIPPFEQTMLSNRLGDTVLDSCDIPNLGEMAFNLGVDAVSSSNATALVNGRLLKPSTWPGIVLDIGNWALLQGTRIAANGATVATCALFGGLFLYVFVISQRSNLLVFVS